LILGFIFYQLFQDNTALHRIPFPYQSRFAQSDFFAVSLLRNYFCDFLWGYALASSLYLLFPQKKPSPLCSAVAFSVGLLYELFQRVGLFSGTGDIGDGFIYLLSATAVYYRIHFQQRRHNP